MAKNTKWTGESCNMDGEERYGLWRGRMWMGEEYDVDWSRALCEWGSSMMWTRKGTEEDGLQRHE